MSSLYILRTELTNFMHMHMHFIAYQRPLIDVHFPYVETKQVRIIGSTQEYMVVAHSFAALSGSYAQPVKHKRKFALAI